MKVARSHHLRCPLCGYLLYSDGRRCYCPRVIPGEHRRCGHGLKGGLDSGSARLPLPSIPERVARLGLGRAS